MSHISVTVRLRPVRFAFLVRPTDTAALLEIFRINTCLWGGKYNPIIPSIKQIPRWWDRHGRVTETAPQVLNGYLDFFEPDFIVEATAGLADGLGYDDDRVLQLSDILTKQGDRDKRGYGLNVMDLYRDLYRKEFQFTRRHEHGIVHVAAREKKFDAFSACLAGDFPRSDNLAYFGKAFVDAFDPETIALDGEALAKLFVSDARSALVMGQSKLNVDYHDHSDPALFVLDATKPQDLIDFWNLRATRRDVLPIPIQWAGELSAFAKEFIELNYRPLPGNLHGVMIQPHVMFSRSIPTEDLEPIYRDNFRVEIEGANVRQDWYPALWRPSPSFTVREMRPTLSANRKTFDVPIDTQKPELRFEGLHPEFASEYGNDDRWANVVNLRDWGLNNQIATAYPTNHRQGLFARLNFASEDLLSTTEGLVVLPKYRGISQFWRLSDGATAIRTWLEKQNVKASPSEAGRATQQIVQTLGGFWGVASIAHPAIVQLLNEISRRPGSRSVQHQEFQNRIRNATKGDIWRHKNFETLVQRNAVELGLEIKCEKCSSWSWHPLKDLGYTVNCGLCLQSFPFPIIEPTSNQHTRWSYRLVGPFALPDSARGGYAAALTLRFFADVIGMGDAQITWSAGQELDLGPKSKAEADVILWYRRNQTFGNDYPTEAIFGEVKSFGREAFTQDDVDRMKVLAERFPGSIIVFSTMKEASELSPQEIARLRKLASWGREYLPRQQRRSRAPVIVLTGTELFTAHYLKSEWEAKGGKHAEIVAHGWVRMDNLRYLADYTQQLYLGMESYSSYLAEKWRRRRARN
ncbi:hypothetical protein [Rhizobium giardinii]|uniref:Uncharacterized protein n=1 Tax=Rhizobium giardinii TaxID=56731 RepID=A0A7W8X7F6_9HYPH|nr:hypothetical protein [Rhizobium giardinii]MBB5535054.1 hypothetical protein [Rhizobium giardinii]